MTHSRWLSRFAALALSLATGLAAAQEAAPADVAKRIQAGMAKLDPDMKVDGVRATPVAGLYEVAIGPRLVYVTGDGRYLIQGSIADLDKREDITEPRRNAIRLDAINRISEDEMVVFGPKDAKYTVTVFTDIDCGFCRRLHAEIAKFNANDIRVRYLFMPRAGKGSESYDKAVAVWCAKDRQQAMTDAKAGKEVPKGTCDNPVEEHLALAEMVGVTGTPALILPDGELLPGYVPAERLKAMLAAQAKSAKR
ncbi:MAG: DsbC family protein [Gammaproteobacteria bacterium]|jgi:thiol:disulfide interchange protein DsbC|nr:DsbC family protein [Gammaproteobacteria bacterium]